MSQPIPVRVLRHKCPHCGRTASRPGRAREHIARCWHNPDAKGCKTCKHYRGWADACGCEPGCNWGGEPIAEHCDVGVSLAGRPACFGCGGSGWADTNVGASVECGPERSVNHIGDGAEIKPGPIVGCDRWEHDA